MPQPDASTAAARRSAPEPERRVVVTKPLKLHTRADGEAGGSMIKGYAAVFNEWTTLYESKFYVWRERVMPGAFKNAIAENQDVRALFNHNPDWILGRTKAGTCRLAEDAVGLDTEIDPPPTQFINDLVVVPMGRGDVTQMSFAFTVRAGGERVTIREENDVVTEERELTDLDLYDASPVTYPAYETTRCQLVERGAAREAEIRSMKAGGRPRPADVARREGRARALALLEMFHRTR